MKKYYLFLFFVIYSGAVLEGQVAQFPQVYYNGQGVTGTDLFVHQSASLSSPHLTSINNISKIGAASYATSTEVNGPATWAKVCLPSTDGNIRYGYILYGQYYIRINAINNYATVTASSLNIRPCAACLANNVTIGGLNAMFGQNSIVALTGNSSGGWYEVYLSNDCSQSTGWVSGTYLSINSNTSNYYNIAGTVKNSSSVYIWGATITMGGWTTSSTEGFYQYKLPVGWSGAVSCSAPGYNTSTPSSYQFAGTGNEYSDNFVVSNGSSCTNSTAPTSASASPSTISSGSSSTLTVNGGSLGSCGSWKWYSGSCGGTFEGNGSGTNGSITVSPTTTTTYFVRAEGGNTTTCANVTVTVSGGCTTPTPYFQASTSTTINQGSTVQFQSNASDNPDQWSWTFPGGTPSSSSAQNPLITYNTPGVYSVTHQAHNSCGWGTPYTATNFITVNSTSNSYTISGTITGATSSGVSVQTTTGISGTSNATGAYTITGVPNTYSGTVSASKAGYTFSPAQQSVSSSNKTNKNFVASAVNTASIAVDNTNSVIPPWQREGDSFSGSITVDLSNAGTNPHWHIEADAFDQTGNYVGPVDIGMGTVSNTISFTSDEVKSYIHQGWHFNWNAVLESNDSVSTASQQTSIIEGQWVNKNVIYYNAPNQHLNIPLKYIQGTTSIDYSFSRVNLTSTANNSDNIENVNFPVSLAGNNHRYISEDYYSPNSNIEYVTPGVFNCHIVYNGTGYKETVQFDLTKIGSVNAIYGKTNYNHGKAVILIAGLNDNIENALQNLPNKTGTGLVNAPWSIADALVNGGYAPSSQNYNTWYIATCNVNSIQKNAYDIGTGLDSIINIIKRNSGVTSPEVNIITHSKGGLETRIMISGKGIPLGGSENSDQNFDIAQPYYSPSHLSSNLMSVIFLGSPHRGARSAYNEYWVSPKSEFAKGVTDLYPSSSLVNYLTKGTIIPQGFHVRVGNLTGYGDSWGDGYFIYPSNFLNPDGDGVVAQSSSENPKISNTDSYRQYYFKTDVFGAYTLPQNQFGIGSSVLHTYLPRLYTLEDAQNTCIEKIHTNSPPYFGYTSGTTSLLDKIIAIINNKNIEPGCSAPNQIQFTGRTSASLLSNATISLYDTSKTYTPIAITDENGNANFYFDEFIPLGDTLMVTAPGIESTKFTIDSNMIKTLSFNIAMFHQLNSTEILEPALTLVDQNQITDQPTIQLKATAKNVTKYLINQSNSDTSFIQITPVNNIITASLDTGYNEIIVKFIGADTVTLSKDVFYYPDTLMNRFARDFTVNVPSEFVGSKMFVNNIFYKDLQASSTFKVLKGDGEIEFTKYGYRDTLFRIDTVNSINLLMQPYSYSSESDSSIINFQNGLNPSYWRNITVKNISNTPYVKTVLKQYDDSFPGLNLIPVSRKFEFKNAGSTSGVKLRTAIALDQADTPDPDSVYYLTVQDGVYKKYEVNKTNVSEYDPEVQKVTFDSIRLPNTNSVFSLCMMKKQPAIINDMPVINIRGGDTLIMPLALFYTDPDQLNDVGVTVNNISVPGSDFQFTIVGNQVIIIASQHFVGDATVNLSATHDFLTSTKDIRVHVLPAILKDAITLYPNPATSTVIADLMLTGKQNYTLKMYDMNGNLVKTIFSNKKFNRGRYQEKVDISRITAGTYIFRLNNIAGAKFIKQGAL